MKKILAILAILTIGFMLLLPTIFAQSANTPALNLTVFPATLDVTAQPGTSVTQKIRVRNNGSSPIDLSLQTSKLSTDTKGTVIPVDSHDSYLSWITYDPSSFTARPNEWTDVTITLKIPQTAAFGYYYAVRVTPKNTAAKTSGGTLIGQALIPLLLTVQKPGATASIQLVSFAPTQSFYEYLPATFDVTFVNKGNVHIRPEGNIFISTGGKFDAAALDINPAQGAMLPGQRRTYTASWNDGFLVEEPLMQDGSPLRNTNGTIKTHLVIHWDKLPSFRIGQYSAHLLAVYDNGTRDVPIEATITFWVFPWKMIVGALAGIIALIFLGKLWLGWYVKRQIRKHKST